MDGLDTDFMEKVNDNILLNREAILKNKMKHVQVLENQAKANEMYTRYILYTCIVFCIVMLMLTCVAVVKVRSLL